MEELEKELEELQDSLAMIDFLETIGTRKRGRAYLIVKVLERIRIKMDGNKNHKLPHVHIDYGEKFHEASYSINPTKRIAGNIRKKYDKDILNWIAKNRVKLLEAWNLLQTGKDTKLISIELQGT